MDETKLTATSGTASASALRAEVSDAKTRYDDAKQEFSLWKEKSTQVTAAQSQISSHLSQLKTREEAVKSHMQSQMGQMGQMGGGMSSGSNVQVIYIYPDNFGSSPQIQGWESRRQQLSNINPTAGIDRLAYQQEMQMNMMQSSCSMLASRAQGPVSVAQLQSHISSSQWAQMGEGKRSQLNNTFNRYSQMASQNRTGPYSSAMASQMHGKFAVMAAQLNSNQLTSLHSQMSSELMARKYAMSSSLSQQRQMMMSPYASQMSQMQGGMSSGLSSQMAQFKGNMSGFSGLPGSPQLSSLGSLSNMTQTPCGPTGIPNLPSMPPLPAMPSLSAGASSILMPPVGSLPALPAMPATPAIPALPATPPIPSFSIPSSEFSSLPPLDSELSSLSGMMPSFLSEMEGGMPPDPSGMFKMPPIPAMPAMPPIPPLPAAPPIPSLESLAGTKIPGLGAYMQDASGLDAQAHAATMGVWSNLHGRAAALAKYNAMAAAQAKAHAMSAMCLKSVYSKAQTKGMSISSYLRSTGYQGTQYRYVIVHPKLSTGMTPFDPKHLMPSLNSGCQCETAAFTQKLHSLEFAVKKQNVLMDVTGQMKSDVSFAESHVDSLATKLKSAGAKVTTLNPADLNHIVANASGSISHHISGDVLVLKNLGASGHPPLSDSASTTLSGIMQESKGKMSVITHVANRNSMSTGGIHSMTAFSTLALHADHMHQSTELMSHSDMVKELDSSSSSSSPNTPKTTLPSLSGIIPSTSSPSSSSSPTKAKKAAAGFSGLFGNSTTTPSSSSSTPPADEKAAPSAPSGTAPQTGSPSAPSGTAPQTGSPSSTSGTAPQTGSPSSTSGTAPQTGNPSSTSGTAPQTGNPSSTSGTNPQTGSPSSTSGTDPQTGSPSSDGKNPQDDPLKNPTKK